MAALVQDSTKVEAPTRIEDEQIAVEAPKSLFSQVSEKLTEKKQWMHGEVVYLNGGYYLRENRQLINLHAILTTRRVGVAILDPMKGWVAYQDLEGIVTRFETGTSVALRR